MALDEKSIRKIMNEILDSNMKKLDAKIDKLISPITKSISIIQKEQADIKDRLRKLEDSNKNLEKDASDLKVKNQQLKNELAQLKDYCDDQEQYIRRECAEIHGVPASQHEDTSDIVKKIGSLVGVHIHDNDISVSHRLKSKKNERCPPIIVRFVRRSTRDKLDHRL